MKRGTAIAATVLGALALTSCGGESSDDDGAAEEQYVSGGTFTVAVNSDPGELVPFTAVEPHTWEALQYAYESLIQITPDGEYVPWLAESWEVSGREVTYTIRDDVTCSDGTPFTAEVAAANINYHADPENGTFYYNSKIDEAVSATAAANKLTVTSETNDAFLLANTGSILMVCQAGLDGPESLAEATSGTGLFELTHVEPQMTYTFTKRDDYNWGPGGVTSETKGLPDTVEVKVLPETSTRANLLLSDELNAGLVHSTDRERLDAAGLEYVEKRHPAGEILFNEHEDRVTSDPLVREALMVALDHDKVGEVVSDGMGIDALSLVNQPPMLCAGDAPEWTLPETNLDRAAALLDEAGWKLGEDGRRVRDGEPLTVKFIFDAGSPSHAASAELIQQTWDELGITTELSANDPAAWTEQLYETSDWDLGWIYLIPADPMVLSTFFLAPTPDQGGVNFMHADSKEYETLAKQARQAESEEAACELWREAEAVLVEDYHAFPLTDASHRTYMADAVFEQSSYIQPTSIRMLD